MLDQAEYEGRTRPTRSERWAALTHGLGARFDARFAVRTAITALCLAALGGISWLWFASNFSPWGSLTTSIFSIAIVPMLSSVSVIAALRHRGLLSDARTLALSAGGVIALTANLLTFMAWSLGFDAAESGISPTQLATLWMPLGLGAWVVGALAVALAVDALLSRTRIDRAGTVILTGVASVIAPPLIGLTLISPFTAAILALGATFLAGMTTRVMLQDAAAPALRPAFKRTLQAKEVGQRHSLVRVLAAIAAVVGGCGIVYAFTGTHWSPVATDGTVAMGQGIMILLSAALPLLGAVGVVLASRTRYRPAHTWGPLGAMALSLTTAALAYTRAPDWNEMAPAFYVGSVLGGLAIAWWMAPRLKFTRPLALTVSVLTGLIYASTVGVFIAPLVAFAVPFIAFTLARRAGRSATSNPTYMATTGTQSS
jgi:hypothetical protein